MTNASPLMGKRILVVEDDYFIAHDIADQLTQRGAEVVGPVSTLQGALQLIEAGDRPFDIAVLDVDLGGMKSFPIAERLIARNQRFIFATGYDEVIIPAQFMDRPRCLKPIDYDQLSRLLDSISH